MDCTLHDIPGHVQWTGALADACHQKCVFWFKVLGTFRARGPRPQLVRAILQFAGVQGRHGPEADLKSR